MSDDGLEPPGCPLPGACSCPGGEAELAKRLANAIRERDAAIAQRDRAVAVVMAARETYDTADIDNLQGLGAALDAYDILCSLSDTPVPDRLAADPFADDIDTIKEMQAAGEEGKPFAQFRAEVEAKLGTRLERLAAEREAGRREGLEAAAKVADSYDFMHPDTSDDFCKGMASDARSISALIRALRDTPAAPETGKTEGGNADG